ncbi:hypothetical protein [Amycolatopsis echigonensis]|uniref:Uncharacterized protein n=1 Tax=Amycolatopsis echigonensis TaxID=2576905 RepID=A0A2N3WNM7_9PSEU|nr:hypothetical protein [Amycolatopsis echigonensis]MBB2498407.1 hypothetical protein [Amycolatopsis echigonensis]PKV95453.1 hypothetical protein ATK30_6374 [Amycolatopsis niigatensis]
MSLRPRTLSRTFVAVGVLVAAAAGTAVPAEAAAPNPAKPSSVEKDIAQLEREFQDLVQEPGVASVLRDSKPLIESPIFGSGRKAEGEPGAIPGCTPGALISEFEKLQASLTDVERRAASVVDSLNNLYASVVANDKSPQVFGTDGQYTPRATAAIDKLRGFWDIESWNIQLVAYKGTDAASPEKMKETFARGFAPERAAAAGALASKVVHEVPALQGGRNPLLSGNAFAAPPDSAGGKRILLGDGLLDLVGQDGFGDVSVEGILGHEYGHHVDFAHDNSPSDESGEMGPDAYAGYFLAHAKGAAWDARAQQEFAYLSASIGDCEHSHGTPAQRKAAGTWGEQQALKQDNPNKIVPSATVIEKFQKEYPKLMKSQA